MMFRTAREKFEKLAGRRQNKTRQNVGHADDVAESKGEPDKTKRITILLGTLVLLLVFTLALWLVVHFTITPKKRLAFCSTAACERLSGLFGRTVSADLKPCANFYKYVCSGWSSEYNTSVYQNHLNHFVYDLGKKYRNIYAGERSWRSAVTKIVQSCIEASTGSIEDPVVSQQFRSFKEELDDSTITWPHLPQQPDIFKSIYRVYRVPTLLSLKKARTGNDTMCTVQIQPGGALEIWRRRQERFADAKTYENYYNYYVNTFRHDAQTEVSTFQTFRVIEKRVIAELHPEDEALKTTTLSSRNLSKMAHFTPNISQRRWAAIMKEICPTASDVGAIITDVEYLQKFDRLLGEIGEDRLELYMGWCALQLMGPLLHPELAKLWYNTSEPELKVAAYAACFQLVEDLIGWSVFDPITSETSHSEVRDKARNTLILIGNALVRAGNRLGNVAGGSPLLNQTDFKEAMHHYFLDWGDNLLPSLNALSSVGQHFSYNWYLLAHVTTEISSDVFQGVLSNYMDVLLGNQNYTLFDRPIAAIRVPPLEITPPVFDVELAPSVQYGALGSLLGTASLELVRSRIPAGSSAEQVLREELKCFRGSANIPWDGQWLGRATTVDIIYEELLKHSAHQYGVEPFTGGQTFFIAMCYLLCDGRNIGGSNMAEITCNEAAKHSKHFSTIFGCEEGKHTMNPEHKCRLF